MEGAGGSIFCLIDLKLLEVDRAGKFRAFSGSGFLVTGFSGLGLFSFIFGLFRARNLRFRAKFRAKVNIFSAANMAQLIDYAV